MDKLEIWLKITKNTVKRCLWKCRLQNAIRFVWTSVCLVLLLHGLRPTYPTSLDFGLFCFPSAFDTPLQHLHHRYGFLIIPEKRQYISTCISKHKKMDSHSKIKRSWNRFIFIMGIPILVRRHLYIETAPSLFFYVLIGWIRINVIRRFGILT